ncbi:hypothetical protein [Xanthomonas arboricola]|uniref:hypothetical protein n=1 Tax=Xanthomonas arboricola TaxID=56448 RepID=UPI0015E2CA66|nr:hypothetical protein [Xanthomonas arboricola]
MVLSRTASCDEVMPLIAHERITHVALVPQLAVRDSTTVPPCASVPRMPGQARVKLWAIGSTARYTVVSSSPHSSAEAVKL